MPAPIRGLSDRELDVLIAKAEEAYARAVRAAFRAASETLVANRTLSAALTPIGGADPTDVIIAQKVWVEHVPELSTHVAGAFGASASSVAVSLSAGLEVAPVAPPSSALAVAGDVVSVVPAGSGLPLVAKFAIDRQAREHLAGAVNRLVNVGDSMWMSIRSELVEGFVAGEGIDKIKARMRGMADISQRRARTIARTEVISASNAGAMAGARAIPELEPETKTWLATSDARTRPSHIAADGQTVPFNEPFSVGGVAMDYPGGPGPAAEVINCRCTVTFSDPADVAALADGADPEGLGDVAAAAARRNTAASAWGVSPDQVMASVPDVARLRAAVRAQAARVQTDALRWLDGADALRIQRPPRGYRGGEYDWMGQLHPAERRRISGNWMDDSAINAVDSVWERAVASGLTHADSVDEFVEEWLTQTRRADAAGALRVGRLPVSNRMGGIDASDISSVLEEQGLDINRIIGVDVEDAAGYLSSVQQSQYADQAYSLLGPSVNAADNAPWRMSFQSWEAEVRNLEEAIGEGTMAGGDVAAANARLAELVPSYLDTGQDYEVLYAEIVETARVAGVDVADHAVIPWATP